MLRRRSNSYFRAFPGLRRPMHRSSIFDVPGGVSGFANFSGQGAYSDPGNNYWNATRSKWHYFFLPLVRRGYVEPRYPHGVRRCSVYTGAQGGQGTPSGLQTPYYDSKPGPKTCTLNNVPAGTYFLYLLWHQRRFVRICESRHNLHCRRSCAEHRKQHCGLQFVHPRQRLRRLHCGRRP